MKQIKTDQIKKRKEGVMRYIKINACFAGSFPCPFYELSNKVHYCTKMMRPLEMGPAIQPWCNLETLETEATKKDTKEN